MGILNFRGLCFVLGREGGTGMNRWYESMRMNEEDVRDNEMMINLCRGRSE